VKDKLITLTVVVLFGLFLAWAAPQINAWAAAEGSNVIECEAGAKVIQLAEGRLRIIGECQGVPPRADYAPVRPDNYVDIELVGDPAYNYPYPVPDEPYPYIDNPCDDLWHWGQECNP